MWPVMTQHPAEAEGPPGSDGFCCTFLWYHPWSSGTLPLATYHRCKYPNRKFLGEWWSMHDFVGFNASPMRSCLVTPLVSLGCFLSSWLWIPSRTQGPAACCNCWARGDDVPLITLACLAACFGDWVCGLRGGGWGSGLKDSKENVVMTLDMSAEAVSSALNEINQRRISARCHVNSCLRVKCQHSHRLWSRFLFNAPVGCTMVLTCTQFDAFPSVMRSVHLYMELVHPLTWLTQHAWD